MLKAYIYCQLHTLYSFLPKKSIFDVRIKMLKYSMKSWHIWVSIFAVFIFGFLFSMDAIAKTAWGKGYQNLALVFNRSDAELAMKLGNYYFNGGEFDLEKAERSYRKAIDLDNKIFWGHYQLARIYFVKGEYEKAIVEINKELEANPENLRSLYVRGLIYGTKGKLAEAESDFKGFVAWAPYEWAGYNDLAWILAKERKYEEAEKVLTEALRKVLNGEKNPWIWNSLGVAQLNLKEYYEAKKSFQKAKELANLMTLKEWQSAYPGNDPAETEKGLLDFKEAIEENLRRSSVDN